METLKDLQRLAIAKHGEDYAWNLAVGFGNIRHKQPWREALASPARSVDEVLKHQQWQQSMRENLL